MQLEVNNCAMGYETGYADYEVSTKQATVKPPMKRGLALLSLNHPAFPDDDFHASSSKLKSHQLATFKNSSNRRIEYTKDRRNGTEHASRDTGNPDIQEGCEAQP